MEEIENKNNLENEEHIKKVYKEKAAKYLKVSIIVLIIMIADYVFGYISSIAFDFGFILVIVDLALVALAYDKVGQNKLELGKKFILVALAPIVIEAIYNLLKILTDLEDVISNLIDFYLPVAGYHYYQIQIITFFVLSIVIVVLLYKAFKSINRAEGNKKVDNDITDDFYDSL